MSESTKHTDDLDLEQIRTELAKAPGRHYWRSLEELAGRPGFDALMAREFPRQAPGLFEAVDRRNFLQLMGDTPLLSISRQH